MPKEQEEMKDAAIQEVVDLVNDVAEQKQRASQAAALQAARDKIRQRGDFVPKSPKSLETVRACF